MFVGVGLLQTLHYSPRCKDQGRALTADAEAAFFQVTGHQHELDLGFLADLKEPSNQGELEG